VKDNLKLGFQKCKPSDKLIAEVAGSIYKVNKTLLTKLFAKGALHKLADPTVSPASQVRGGWWVLCQGLLYGLFKRLYVAFVLSLGEGLRAAASEAHLSQGLDYGRHVDAAGVYADLPAAYHHKD
jgi:hypothetical protein